MSIRRAPRPESGWFLVRNDVARDARLSPKARGILFFMLSFPNDWRLDHRTIARTNGVGRDYVLSALKELRKYGYLVQERRRGEKGQWVTDTVLYDTPRPSTGNPDPADPDPAEPDLYEGLSPDDCPRMEMSSADADASGDDVAANPSWESWRNDDWLLFRELVGSDHIDSDGSAGIWKTGRYTTEAMYRGFRDWKVKGRPLGYPGKWLKTISEDGWREPDVNVHAYLESAHGITPVE